VPLRDREGRGAVQRVSGYHLPMPARDDDDWVGTPPEGRHTRDQAKPDYWNNQWQAIVASSVLAVVVLLAIVLILVF
jgi:hypothetical protein